MICGETTFFKSLTVHNVEQLLADGLRSARADSNRTTTTCNTLGSVWRRRSRSFTRDEISASAEDVCPFIFVPPLPFGAHGEGLARTMRLGSVHSFQVGCVARKAADAPVARGLVMRIRPSRVPSDFLPFWL